jgi:CRP-like cAMP-binding protein
MSSTYQAVDITGASLEGVRLLAPLPLDERNQIAARCGGRRYPAGAMVVTSEAPDDDVYFLLSGSCRASYFSSSGREVSFRDLEPGEMFGEISAIDGLGRSATVLARSESSLAVLGRQDFLELIYENRTLAHATLVHLTTIVRTLSNRVVEFSTLGVKNRIHAELLRIAGEVDPDASSASISPSPRHADIAARVSTHREAVTREFGELQKSGVIERRSGELLIHDLAALRRLVQDPTQER